MASYEAVCVVCGKPFRRTSGTDTVAVMQESPAVHAPGSEGDEDCLKQYQAGAAEREREAAEADLAAARARVDALKPAAEEKPSRR